MPIITLEKLWKSFDQLTVGMEVPLRRRRNAQWLLRNLSARNSHHEKLDETLDVLKEIVKREKWLPKNPPELGR
jgi:hypothetical protein